MIFLGWGGIRPVGNRSAGAVRPSCSGPSTFDFVRQEFDGHSTIDRRRFDGDSTEFDGASTNWRRSFGLELSDGPRKGPREAI
jgi:hypothetical protein